MEIKQKEGMKIEGTVTVRCYKAGTVDAVRPIYKQIKNTKEFLNCPDVSISDYTRISAQNSIEQLKAKAKSILDAGFIRTALVQKNIVMDSTNYGIDLIIQRLIGINTYSLNIAYGEIGTGSTTPTVNDTALTTPSSRLPVSFSEDYANTTAILQWFWTDAQLANASYYEFGTFVDGSATIGSGQLFNHALFSSAPYVKVSGQDTTVEVDYLIT